MPTVLGLDLSLRSSGAAVINLDGRAEYFSFGYALKKDATTRDKLERIIFITNKIVHLIRQYKVEWVGIENYAFSRGLAGKLTEQADLGGCVKAQILLITKNSPILLPSTAVRAFLLSEKKKYTQKKGLVKVAIRQELEALGYGDFENLDQSDALATGIVVHYWANRREIATNKQRIKLFELMDRQIERS